MTRHLNLGSAGRIVGVTVLALIGLTGCAAGAGSNRPMVDNSVVAPTADATVASGSLPVAEIVTADATVVGDLGTYTLDGRGSDAPWLPFSSLPSFTAGTADVLRVRFSDRVVIAGVSAIIATADDTAGSSTRGVGGTVLDAGGSSVSIGPLPAGRWVLEVRLFRADGRGDGLTYWAVTVR